ncbi:MULTISPECIES: SMI1/KNR4 family protein [Streptomyces]|uniref:SMI1/KNR4 family protein n=1 Tax=Streptomyces TaxID=1883 RepID=UPI00025CD535|nr:SMI1/KNR4 family protein [Streptomyces tsukubensis]AZK97316.1 glucan synthesis protein [Streptomyces tsukubensis]EIF93451.1 putative glucan synthasis protein [Streptomyces tsukubensis NRRL18488]
MAGWSVLCAEMDTVKRRLKAHDRRALWPHEPRRPPAPPERIAGIATVTLCPVDPDYAAFLRHADGWPGILQDIDLFGTRDFGTSAYADAEESVRTIQEVARIERDRGFSRLVPIGASRDDIDVLVLHGNGKPDRRNPVSWFAGGEVERYPTFTDFFLAMIAANEAEADFLARPGRPGPCSATVGNRLRPLRR